jgi:uncharacterized RDD family membrane protein YckC
MALRTLDDVDPRTFRTAWRRMGAVGIDVLIVAAVEFLLLTALRIQLPFVSEQLVDRRYVVLDAVVGLAYPIVLHRLFGQTVGKWVTRVRLVALDLGPITWIQAVVRESPWIVLLITRSLAPLVFRRHRDSDEAAIMLILWQLGALLVWIAADLVAMLSSSRRRALHDLLARTVVVRVAKRPIAVELRPATT